MRQLRRELFLQEEVPAFDLLVHHYRQYGEIPTADVFVRAGIILTEPQGGFDYHLNQIRMRALYNAAADISGQINQRLQARTDQNADEIVALIQQLSNQAGAIRAQEDIQSIGHAAGDVVEQYLQAHARATLLGIPMGWPRLDQITAGAQPGDLIVWVARRNVGKTYLSVRQAMAAWDDGCRTMMISNEMPIDQVARRIVGMRAGLNPDLIRRGMLSTHAFGHMQGAVNQLRADGRAPFWLLQGSMRKDTGLVDSLVQEFSPDIVVIDGSYLMKPIEKGINARWEKQAAIHEELKTIAMSRGIPVVCVVQESRGGKGNKSGDGIVAGSDVIEQLASVMVRVQHGLGEHESDRRRLDVVKNRDGQLGKFQIHFEFEPMNFEEDLQARAEEAEQEQAREQQLESMAGLRSDMT